MSVRFSGHAAREMRARPHALAVYAQESECHRLLSSCRLNTAGWERRIPIGQEISRVAPA